MNILLISECQKNALKETRRILDQFAERAGQRTWQTPITEAGLKTLQKLLRKTARRNTAVACYWTRGKNHTELLWVVGNQNRFNDIGRVPTNRTQRNILRRNDESEWQYGEIIQIIATLAALFHDLGKATIGFQIKLESSFKGERFNGDPFRHEWISLQLFKLMIQGCQTNSSLLERLIKFKEYREANPDWHKALGKSHHEECFLPSDQYPSLAQMIGWLIVSHHRMPFYDFYLRNSRNYNVALTDEQKIHKFEMEGFYTNLKAVDYWVKNPNSEHSKPNQFWELANDITASISWQKSVVRWANRALNHQGLSQLSESTFIDPLIFYLSRLALITGDHNYSSLDKSESDLICRGDSSLNLIANLDKKWAKANKHKRYEMRSEIGKQQLDQHLIGVARITANFAYLLPKLNQELMGLKNHRPFVKRTRLSQFKWQDRAYDLAASLQKQSETEGFFGVNMASTGLGKTIGNARIFYALANPEKGARFTIALGLRTLTMQTGSALRNALKLDEEQLAVLVGGDAQRTLFNLNEEEKTDRETSEKYFKDLDDLAEFGSESLESWLSGGMETEANLQFFKDFPTLITDQKAQKLLATPIISCTIDHLIAASETARGGRHIAPILRLLTSDLILDEPDDFDQNDLPALARLIYLAGLFGSRVQLSSATLTPDLVIGLFDAYEHGRKIWSRAHNHEYKGTVSAWFDEFNVSSHLVNGKINYASAHSEFVQKRVEELQRLREKEGKRKGMIVPFRSIAELCKDKGIIKNQLNPIFYKKMAEKLIETALSLHAHHHEVSEHGQNVSIGLIRIANIKNIIEIAKATYTLDIPQDTEIHLVIYHSRQLLILRSELEAELDRILKRDKDNSIFQHSEIKSHLNRSHLNHSEVKNHLFIVLGSPVTEVGRDHDYDWAILEPSSMRSIIQLAGRVWRHRNKVIDDAPNIAVMNSSIRALLQENLGLNKPAFKWPGFESEEFLLDSHLLEEIIEENELNIIDSIPRIQKQIEIGERERFNSLSALEHGVMEHYLNPRQPNFVTAFWQEGLAHPALVHLQSLTPFRSGDPETSYICQPDDNQRPWGFSFRNLKNALEDSNVEAGTVNSEIRYLEEEAFFPENPQIKPWLNNNLEDALVRLAGQLGTENLDYIAIKYATVSLPNRVNSWFYHPWLGFIEK